MFPITSNQVKIISPLIDVEQNRLRVNILQPNSKLHTILGKFYIYSKISLINIRASSPVIAILSLGGDNHHGNINGVYT